MRYSENIEKFLEFLCDISFTMFEKNDPCLEEGKDEYEIPTLSFEGVQVKILEFPIKHIFEQTNERIEFVHNSIYEFFVAHYMYRKISNATNISLEKVAETLGGILNQKYLSNEILEYLEYIIQKNISNVNLTLLVQAFQTMLKNGMTYYVNSKFLNILEREIYVFMNMLELLEIYDVKTRIGLENQDYIINYIKFCSGVVDQKLNLKKLHLQDVQLINTILSGARLSGVNLARANLRGIHLESADLEDAHLEGTELKGAYLEEANLNKAYLREANLEEAHLDRSDLRGVYLTGNNLRGSSLKNANLNRVSFKRVNLRGADLRNANLEEADLSGSHLENCNLNNANLRRARLYKTNLKRANLRNVCLEGANLRKARMDYADLRGSYMEGADLSGVNLGSIKLDSQTISGVILDVTQLEELKNYDLKDIRVYTNNGILPYDEYIKKFCNHENKI